MAKRPLAHTEVQRILRALEPLAVDRRIVLVGGQAIAFWTRFLALHSDDAAVRLPLASKD